MTRTKPKLTRWLMIAALVFAVVACGLPPTQLVVIISPTPDPNVIMITVTPPGSAADLTHTPVEVAAPPTNTPAEALSTNTPGGAIALPPTSAPAVTATFVPTATLSAFPTETRAQILIAQQDFERGFMFWISTANPKVIWVLINSPDNPNAGEWRIFVDSYQDGEPEFDPNITPPDANHYQPRRGFGKVWRNTPGLRDALGWGTTPEFALNTTYVYQPGGYIDANGTYVPGPGKHFLTALSRQTFAMIEALPGQGTPRWEKVG